MSANVKTLLLLSSLDHDSSFSFLFYFAKFWAQQGNRVLFISATPPTSLPFSIGETDPSLNPDVFKMIQFMYLTNWKELLTQLYSIHLRHNPVSVIIIKNLENYFKSEATEVKDIPSLVSGSLLYAASICSQKVNQEVILISEYLSKELTINKNVVLNFFHNIWEIVAFKENHETISLQRLSFADNNDVVLFRFKENLEESKLKFIEVVRKVFDYL